MPDITTVTVSNADITSLSISNSEITSTIVSNTDITVLTQTSGTINLASLNFSNTAPAAVVRTASVGSSNSVARADHVHSAANLLLDGGSY
jgi:hypothetical protein